MSKKAEITLPFDALVGSVTAPVLEPITQGLLEDAMMPLLKQTKWRDWEMHFLKPALGAILLEGPSGVGKSTVAYHYAKQIGKGIVEISMGSIGGEAPGETEKNIHKIFKLAAEKAGPPTLFLDECDGLLWSREHVSKDSMFMLGVKGALLKELERYQGMVFLATNMAHLLDHALERRVTRVAIGIPGPLQRYKLWEAKLPPKFFYPKQSDLTKLASIEITGAQIENAIIATAKQCLRLETEPSLKLLCEAARSQRKTSIPKKDKATNHTLPRVASDLGITSAQVDAASN